MATDERGSVWRTDAGWQWLRPGYVLDVPADGGSATLFPLGKSPSSADREAGALGVGSAITLAYGIRHVLTVLLPRIDWIPVHAAAVELSDETVLLVGPSGCGKSTLTMGLVQRGGTLISDDLVALSPPDETGQVAAWSLTRGVRLLPDACNRFGLSGRPSPVFGRARDKQHVDLGAGRPIPGASPTIVVAPTIADRPQSELRLLSPTTAFPLLGQQMLPPMFLSPVALGVQMRRTANLLRQCKGIIGLQAGHDLYETPSSLADFLAPESPVRASAQ
jgi:hypothetical protein